MMKLNLGCGVAKRMGYVNIDKRQEVKPDLVLDLEEAKLPFPDASCSEILANDILEHLSHRVVRQVLKEWRRVLQQRGRLLLRVPDLEAICRIYLNNDDFQQISYWLYGEQDYPENTHKTGFTVASLKKLLETEGFEVLKIRGRCGTNIECEAVKV